MPSQHDRKLASPQSKECFRFVLSIKEKKRREKHLRVYFVVDSGLLSLIFGSGMRKDWVGFRALCLSHTNTPKSITFLTIDFVILPSP